MFPPVYGLKLSALFIKLILEQKVVFAGPVNVMKDYISRCERCRNFEISNQKETLMPHELPSRPWEKVGTDLFSLDGRGYLITVDYLSNFWEVDRLPDTKSTTVIRKLKAHFARNGSPNYVVSDGGPQYMSEEFKRFAREWDFEHVTSSPHHQNANGKAEAAVKMAKRTMRNARSEMETYIKPSWSYVTHRVRV